MIFQDLNTLHLVCRYVIAGLGILTSHQIKTFNVKMIYRFSLIRYTAVRLYFQTWHFPYHIGYTAVLYLLETCYGICQSITPFTYTFGFYRNLTKLKACFFHSDNNLIYRRIILYSLCFIPQKAESDICNSTYRFKSKVTLSI